MLIVTVLVFVHLYMHMCEDLCAMCSIMIKHLVSQWYSIADIELMIMVNFGRPVVFNARWLFLNKSTVCNKYNTIAYFCLYLYFY